LVDALIEIDGKGAYQAAWSDDGTAVEPRRDCRLLSWCSVGAARQA
jgi:hypothetical protein